MNLYSFPKSEKLCGKIRIKKLYDNGRHFSCYPLRVTWYAEAQSPDLPVEPRVLIWAPKSLFRHAVARNRMRRLLREAYRLNALPFKQYCRENRISAQIAFNYIAKEQLPYADIEKAMKKALTRLQNAIAASQNITPLDSAPETASL